MVEWDFFVWNTKFLRLPIFDKATKRTNDLVSTLLEHFAEAVSVLLPGSRHVLLMVTFCTKVETWALQLATGGPAPSLSYGTAERLRPEKILYIFTEAEAYKKVNFLRGGVLDWIEREADLRGVWQMLNLICVLLKKGKLAFWDHIERRTSTRSCLLGLEESFYETTLVWQFGFGLIWISYLAGWRLAPS